jgi:ribosomal protein S18 acetylase RimI-like enzyme
MKQNIEIKALNGISHEIIHKAFVEAFSDYQVQVDVPLWKLELMLSRRSYRPALSLGAFREGKMIGFVLNGFREWQGISTAYDVGTGVIPDARRQGITSEMLKMAQQIMREAQIKRYLLEVIDTNENAEKLYRSQGFETVRTFSCFRGMPDKVLPRHFTGIERVERLDFEKMRAFNDIQPSWQNAEEAILATPADYLIMTVNRDNRIVGYGVMDRATGDVAQIAIDPAYRRLGLGSDLLYAMVHTLKPEKISMLNVVSDYLPLIALLEVHGMRAYVGQYEMMMTLDVV